MNAQLHILVWESPKAFDDPMCVREIPIGRSVDYAVDNMRLSKWVGHLQMDMRHI